MAQTARTQTGSASTGSRAADARTQARRYKKTLVVVSHDRGFLNEVTTDIIHLHDFALHYYRGNFARFEEMYEQRRKAANKEFEKFEKQLKVAQARGPHCRGCCRWRRALPVARDAVLRPEP